MSKLITINLCLAFFTTIVFAQNPCREADSLALVQLYNSVIFKSDNEWDLTQPIDSWHGVTTDPDGCVHSLDLYNSLRNKKHSNSLSINTLTADMLQQLNTLDLSDNYLTHINLDINLLPALNTFNIANNKLNFNDLTNLSVPSGITFTYAPQEVTPPYTTEYTSYAGLNQTIFVEYMGAATEYVWLKDGMHLDTTTTDAGLELTDLQVDDTGVYFAELSHPDFPDLALESSFITLTVGTARERDSLALVSFYENVTFKNNEWDLTQPMNTWYGVTLSPSGGVIRLEIPNTLEGGSGYLNNQLIELTHLDLRDNNLTGSIGVNYGPAISSVKISGNRMRFNDIHYSAPPAGVTFEYAPQADYDIRDDLAARATGEKYTLNVNSLYFSDNVFNWYKDGQFFFTTPNNILTFSFLQSDNIGYYSCQITNSGYPDLTIYTDSVYLIVDNCRLSDSLALVALYDAVEFLPGQAWDLTQPMHTWAGITVDPDEGCVEEIELPYSMSGGTIPQEITQIRELGYLNLAGNNLGAEMGTAFANYGDENVMPNLYHLDLSYNEIIGGGYAWFMGAYSVPENAKNFEYLDLSFNRIESIQNIRKLNNLSILNLSNNIIRQDIRSLLPQSPLASQILLHNNKVTGGIKDEDISEYNYLINLRIEDNEIENITQALYDLPQLEELSLANNRLTFSDLNSEVFSFPDMYNPQDTVGQPYTLYLEPYTELNYTIGLDFDNNIPNNTYTWYKDGVQIAVTQQNSYELLDIIPEYAGVYTCEVTNPDFPALTLHTAPITIITDETYTTNCRLRDSLAVMQILPEYAWQLGTPLGEWQGILLNEEGCVFEFYYGDNLGGEIISSAIGMLLDVESIGLDENGMKGAIPRSIGQLIQLKTLNLRDNNLTTIPYEITELPNLEYLYLGGNAITEVPAQWGNSTKLKTLNLSENRITQLPPGIGDIGQLEDLTISNNQLTTIPLEISNLSNLRTLSISNNPLEEAPEVISTLTNLELLIMENCELLDLPDNIGNLINLKELRINNNPLGELPDDIGLLANLERLSAEACQLLALPDEFANLTNLIYLNVSNNHLQDLPPNFAQNLTQLDNPRVAYNQLTFEDLIPLQTLNYPYYVEQNTIGTPHIIYASAGSDVAIDLGFDENVTGSTYQWFHFTDLVATTTTNQLTLTNIQEDDAGPYWCRITNPAYSSIILETAQIQLIVLGEEVYPGDTNTDGIVDNEDVLFWGLVTGSNGPARQNASVEWIPQAAEDWANYLLGINGKHQDADGNGLVDDGDLDVIEANYYNTTDFYEEMYNSENQLQLEPTIANAQNSSSNSSYDIQLDLSSITQGAATVHGLAFTVDYSQLQNVESYSSQLNDNNSWINPDEAVAVHDTEAQRSDFVITRTDLQNQTSIGTVGTLVVATVNLPTIDQNPSLGITLRNICAIQSDGTMLHAEDVFIGSFSEGSAEGFIAQVEFDAIAYAATCEEPSSASVIVTNGNPPYQYEWSNGDTNATAENLDPGYYEIVVTDAMGQSLTGFVEVPNGTPLPDIQLETNPNGEINLIHNDPDATFLWNGQISGSVATLTPGEHTLEVNNSAGCSKTLPVWVVDIFANVLLEGNYDPDPQLMHDDLRRLGLIPLTDPYHGTMTMDSVVLDTTGSTAIVDWVLLEFHVADEVGKVASSTPALLRRDGEIVANDGISPVRIAVSEVSDYYMVVKHRNHLPVKTLNLKSVTNPVVTHDFETGNNSLQKQIANGAYCLFAGDVSGENNIDGLDKIIWEPMNGTFNQYHPADTNLDGDINGADKGIWFDNNGTFTDIE